jgi:hypothetical protein
MEDDKEVGAFELPREVIQLDICLACETFPEGPQQSSHQKFQRRLRPRARDTRETKCKTSSAPEAVVTLALPFPTTINMSSIVEPSKCGSI